MLQSKVFIPSLREVPKEAVINSHKLLLKGGYIKQNAAGVYTYLPLAYRILMKIEKIIREELNKVGCSEMLMPALQLKELWQESGRWDAYGKELMRLNDRHERAFCLGPTHEEVITSIVRDYISSYKKLPLALYQIQTKFRDEFRPRFGLMRGREFIMKDLYTFHASSESLDEWYNLIKAAYHQIIKRLGLHYRSVKAASGQIGGTSSEEFMALCEVGEDTICYSDSSDFATNSELGDFPIGSLSPDGKGHILHAKSIEVGHIFKLGTKYSESMNAYFLDKDQTKKPIIMGCYGIGVSRILMAVVEQACVDENKMVWPASITPYDVHIIVLDNDNLDIALEIEKQNSQLEYLIDDRDERAGVKFKDADLIGVRHRVIIGRDISSGLVEYKDMLNNTSENITLDELAKRQKQWKDI